MSGHANVATNAVTSAAAQFASDGVVSSELRDTVGTTGVYKVVFDRRVLDCVFQATTGSAGITNTSMLASSAQVGRAIGADLLTGVHVFIHDENGDRADNRDFHLSVTC